MDLVLMIIAICFRNSNEPRNYNALTILSIIGIVIMFFGVCVGGWIYIFDLIWFIIDFILCETATNRKVVQNNIDADTGEDIDKGEQNG